MTQDNLLALLNEILKVCTEHLQSEITSEEAMEKIEAIIAKPNAVWNPKNKSWEIN